MNNQSSIIFAETVASKLAALKNLQAPAFAAALAAEPRLVELIWFLQWSSIQPGGLVKLVEDLLALCPDNIGTAAMRKTGKTDQPYTMAERQAIIDNFPSCYGEHPYGNAPRYISEMREILGQFSNQMRGDYWFAERKERKANASFVNKQNHSYFADYCRRLALVELPVLIRAFCTEPDNCLPDGGKTEAGPAFYFHDLAGALLEMMDAHAARQNQNIAPTVVTTQIFDAIDFACAEKAMVEIIGDSRFGKTEAVKTWCNASPGKARLVKTPCDNSERSFFEALADAAGCDFTFDSPARQVKLKVSHILKYGGLCWVFDESAWLIPQRFGKLTTPIRLNYIRSLALDNGSPVVLVKTPQFFQPAADKFQKTTGFNMAQFEGRIMRQVVLPSALPELDLFAIVKLFFPELSPALAKKIVAAAMGSANYLFTVEKISKNARAVAHKNGHATIQEDDLKKGIALSGIIVRYRAASMEAEVTPSEPRTRPAAKLEAPARAITPETQPV